MANNLGKLVVVAIATSLALGVSACGVRDGSAGSPEPAQESTDASTIATDGVAAGSTVVESAGGSISADQGLTTVRFEGLHSGPADSGACALEGFFPRGGGLATWVEAGETFDCGPGGRNGHGYMLWDDGGLSSVRFWFGEETERTYMCHQGERPPVIAASVDMTMFSSEFISGGSQEVVSGLTAIEVAVFSDPSAASTFLHWQLDSFDRECGVSGVLDLNEEMWGPAVSALDEATFGFDSVPTSPSNAIVFLVGRVGSELVRVEFHGTGDVGHITEIVELVGQVASTG